MAESFIINHDRLLKARSGETKIDENVRQLSARSLQPCKELPHFMHPPQASSLFPFNPETFLTNPLPTSSLPRLAILTLSTPGCSASGAPAAGPSPVIMLSTPGGSPTSAAMAPSSRQVLHADRTGATSSEKMEARVTDSRRGFEQRLPTRLTDVPVSRGSSCRFRKNLRA
jgi:hypothetical protein